MPQDTQAEALANLENVRLARHDAAAHADVDAHHLAPASGRDFATPLHRMPHYHPSHARRQRAVEVACQRNA